MLTLPGVRIPIAYEVAPLAQSELELAGGSKGVRNRCLAHCPAGSPISWPMGWPRRAAESSLVYQRLESRQFTQPSAETSDNSVSRPRDAAGKHATTTTGGFNPATTTPPFQGELDHGSVHADQRH
jgi:hypothetical protein